MCICSWCRQSLYTTLREFIENSLDAAEAIRVLPEIEVRIEKLSTREFQLVRGVEKHQRADLGLYHQTTDKAAKGKKKDTTAAAAAAAEGDIAASQEKEDKVRRV